MSNTEYRTMFALWCAVKSPLMLGSDLSKVDINSETFEVKSNHNLNNLRCTIVPSTYLANRIQQLFLFTNFMQVIQF